MLPITWIEIAARNYSTHVAGHPAIIDAGICHIQVGRDVWLDISGVCETAAKGTPQKDSHDKTFLTYYLRLEEGIEARGFCDKADWVCHRGMD
jgi:hypothetical protein